MICCIHSFFCHSVSHLFPNLNGRGGGGGGGLEWVITLNIVFMWLKLLHMLSTLTLQWRHNEHDGASNHQPHYCLFNRLFRHRWKKTSKLRVTGLCEGNSPVSFKQVSCRHIQLVPRISKEENYLTEIILANQQLVPWKGTSPCSHMW